ncbi:unnamed protein product, partial [Staurois parvus]
MDMEVSGQKEQSKCRQGTGQSSRDKMYVKCYVIIILKKMNFLKNFKFAPVPAPVRPDVTGTGTRKPEAGCRHRPEEMAGDAAGDT